MLFLLKSIKICSAFGHQQQHSVPFVSLFISCSSFVCCKYIYIWIHVVSNLNEIHTTFHLWQYHTQFHIICHFTSESSSIIPSINVFALVLTKNTGKHRTIHIVNTYFSLIVVRLVLLSLLLPFESRRSDVNNK